MRSKLKSFLATSYMMPKNRYVWKDEFIKVTNNEGRKGCYLVQVVDWLSVKSLI